MKQTVHRGRCPACKQPIRDPATKQTIFRGCAACKKQIERHHKWHFNDKGRVVHRCCEHPLSYCSPPRHMRLVQLNHGGTGYRLEDK